MSFIKSDINIIKNPVHSTYLINKKASNDKNVSFLS